MSTKDLSVRPSMRQVSPFPHRGSISSQAHHGSTTSLIPVKTNSLQTKVSFKSPELEHKLAKLRGKIQKHRLQGGGDCWFFGIEDQEFDYGASWDNAEYWHNIIKKTGGGTLEAFGYRYKDKSCSKCKVVTKEMNRVWDKWLILLKRGEIKEISKEEKESSSFLNKIFCCFQKEEQWIN